MGGVKWKTQYLVLPLYFGFSVYFVDSAVENREEIRKIGNPIALAGIRTGRPDANFLRRSCVS